MDCSDSKSVELNNPESIERSGELVDHRIFERLCLQLLLRLNPRRTSSICLNILPVVGNRRTLLKK
jgi:hypothetical protein